MLYCRLARKVLVRGWATFLRCVDLISPSRLRPAQLVFWRAFAAHSGNLCLSPYYPLFPRFSGRFLYFPNCHFETCLMATTGATPFASTLACCAGRIKGMYRERRGARWEAHPGLLPETALNLVSCSCHADDGHVRPSPQEEVLW